MNPDTGELRRIKEMAEAEINELTDNGFYPIPDDLKDIADKELGNKESVILPQEHPLVQEMKKRANDKAKKKKHSKIAKESKRRNRR